MTSQLLTMWITFKNTMQNKHLAAPDGAQKIGARAGWRAGKLSTGGSV